MENFNHPIDFRSRVIKIKTGASCSGQTESSHKGLIAMVAAAQCQTMLIGERSQIVWVCRFHHEANKRAARRIRTETANQR